MRLRVGAGWGQVGRNVRNCMRHEDALLKWVWYETFLKYGCETGGGYVRPATWRRMQGVCDRTSTPNKSGKKMKRKKNRCETCTQTVRRSEQALLERREIRKLRSRVGIKRNQKK